MVIQNLFANLIDLVGSHLSLVIYEQAKHVSCHRNEGQDTSAQYDEMPSNGVWKQGRPGFVQDTAYLLKPIGKLHSDKVPILLICQRNWLTTMLLPGHDMMLARGCVHSGI